MPEKKYRSIDEIAHRGKPLREILEEHRAWVQSDGREGSKAALSGANLRGASLFDVDLRGANLFEANLSGANLYTANLSGAHLSGAHLFGAHLIGANLNGANIKEAEFLRTVVADCDLSSVIGLEEVRHLGSSSIGIDTILKSQGKIPEAFLKGAGVPDIWITYARSLLENPIEFYSCFISYSDKDKEFCERLYADLQAKGVRCWYFPEDATWGKSVWGEIDRSIRVYDKLVVVCSENSLNSGPVIREIERALQREDREQREVLFPIRIDDYLFDKWEHGRKADVKEKVVGDFRDWQDHTQYKKNFNRLLDALNRKPAEQP